MYSLWGRDESIERKSHTLLVKHRTRKIKITEAGKSPRNEEVIFFTMLITIYRANPVDGDQ